MSDFSWIRVTRERHFYDLTEAKNFCDHMNKIGFSAELYEYKAPFTWSKKDRASGKEVVSKAKNDRNKNRYTVSYNAY